MSGPSAGVELYLLSDPVPFAAAPMVHVAGGRFRIADRSRRHWPEDPQFELLTSESAWEPLRTVTVDRLSGTCELPERPESGCVRASGRFLPMARIGVAEAWKLDLGFVGVDSLDGGSSAFSGAKARLLNVRLDPEYLHTLQQPVVALLGVTSSGGHYEAVGRLLGNEIPIAADELALAIDAGALTYTDA